MILRPILRPVLRSPLRSVFDGGVGAAPVVYDYYVNGDTGSDSNDGLTPATAKATIQAVSSLFLSAIGDKAVYVAPGTYKGGPYFNQGASGPSSRRTITYYMAGVTVDNQDDAAGNFQNAVFTDAKNLTVEVVGPCVLTNTANDIANAHGTHSAGQEATIIMRDATCTAPGSGGDGFSCHGTCVGYAYDCTFVADGNKSAIVHIDNSRTFHYRCDVYIKSGTGGQVQVSGVNGSPEAYFEDCQFIMQGTNLTALTVNTGGENTSIARFTRCRWLADGGTFNVNGTNGNAGTIELIDCYSEGFGTELNADSVMRGCYGDWRIRLARGDGSGNVVIENNTISRASTDLLLWNAFGTGEYNGGAGGTIRNNIFMSANTAIRTAVTTSEALAAINSLWSFENNLFFDNNNNYTAGIIPDGVDVTGQDPLLVSGSGPDQAGWLVQPGSPAIGAGTGGSNIGIGVAA